MYYEFSIKRMRNKISIRNYIKMLMIVLSICVELIFSSNCYFIVVPFKNRQFVVL